MFPQLISFTTHTPAKAARPETGFPPILGKRKSRSSGVVGYPRIRPGGRPRTLSRPAARLPSRQPLSSK